MIQNFLKIAIRNLFKQKAYSLINILGLALGLAASIIIYLYVQDELSFDKYHDDAQNIYRWETAWEENGELGRWAASTGGWVQRLKDNYPEIAAIGKINKSHFPMVFRNDQIIFNEADVISADSTFFEIFTFETITPEPQNFLNKPGTMVLTESTAKKYFGAEDPLGKVLNSGGRDFTVSGIMKDVPKNSHLKFDMILSMETLRTIRPEIDDDGPLAWYTYFRVNDQESAKSLEEKLQTDIYRLAGFPEDQLDSLDLNVGIDGLKTIVGMMPVVDIHLHSNSEKELEVNGSFHYVQILMIIALFILLIACINYINLATARSAKRAREVGIRKTLGSSKRKIFNQFILESLLLVFIALIISLVLVEIILPEFNQFSGKNLSLSLFNNLKLSLILFSIFIFVGGLSGLYPALFMAQFKPITILNSSSGANKKTKSALYSRRILVIAQFAISIFLITSAINIYLQLKYIQNRGLGFDKEQVIVLPRANGKEEILKSELQKITNVIAVTNTSTIPGERVPFLPTRIPSLAGKTNNYVSDESGTVVMRVWGADADVEEVFGLKIVEGRGLDKNRANDAERGFLLNEAAVRALELSDPIGTEIEYVYRLEVPKQGEIVGVIEDFHYASLHNEVEPLVIHTFPRYDMHTCIKISPHQVNETIKQIRSIWEKTVEATPFEVEFLDGFYDGLYRQENNMGKLVTAFTLLALVLAGLGLFGLASFITEQRAKEIAIRKILGASITSIIANLSREFIILVILANLISIFPAYIFIRNWLNNFAYHINVSWATFLLSAIFSILIALLTVALQALKAAKSNPVEALKYE